MIAIRDTIGAEAILPFCYGGSNGLLTQDTIDAQLFRGVRHVAAGAHGLRRADRRRQPGALRQDAGRHLPGLLHARLIVLWGVNPSASGIHLVPFIKEARSRGASSSSSIRARRRWRDRPTCTSRRGRAPICRRARAAPVPVRARARRQPRSSASTRAAPKAFARAPSDGRSNARRRRARSTPPTCDRFAALYASVVAGADPLRLGPRAQPQRRQRRGGGPGAARRRRASSASAAAASR